MVFAFGACLQAPFQFDDHGMLADPAVTSPEGWADVWRWQQTRPLTYFTFWLNYALGGANPAGYHAMNLALHCGAVVLVWLCLRRLIPVEAAVIATFVFALHPVQSEAVNYIFARSTLLAALLTLGAFLAWLHGRHWWSVAIFAVALLAKEEVAAFPVLLAFLHVTVSYNRAERKPIAVMLALAALFTARLAWVAAVAGSGAGAQSGVRPADYFLTQGWVILRYFQLLAVPIGFTADPDIELATPWRGAVCWAAILFAIYVASHSVTKLRAGFWFIGALILMAPTSSLFPAQDLAADRRLYLPMLGFAAAAGQILRGTRFPVVLTAGAVVLAMLTHVRTNVWGSEVTLWEDAMRRAPGKLRPRLQLARASEPGTGIRLLEEVKESQSNSPELASELGRAYLNTGRLSDALSEFGRALALEPNDPMTLNNRGVTLAAMGLRDAALADFIAAAGRDPCLFDARLNLKKLGAVVTLPGHCRYSARQRMLWEELVLHGPSLPATMRNDGSQGNR